MKQTDGRLQSGTYEGHRILKLIPLVIRYSAGAPSIVQNPTNEQIALTDNGTGDVTLTLASAAEAPLIVAGFSVLAAAATLSNVVNLKSAPTKSVIVLQNDSVADGTTEADPIDIHLMIVKQEVAS